LGFGKLSLCPYPFVFFISSLRFAAFSMRRMLSIPAPQGGVLDRVPFVAVDCNRLELLRQAKEKDAIRGINSQESNQQ